MRDINDEPRASREARAEMRADAEDAKDRAYRKRMGELAAEGAVTPISPTTVRVNGPTLAATDLPGGERAPLIAVHGGHMYEGTWEEYASGENATCTACGARRFELHQPDRCPGWPSTGGADALLRLVRGLTAEVRDDAPRTHREAARDAFAHWLGRVCAPDVDQTGVIGRCAQAWQKLAQADADEQRALRLALAASDPHVALRSFLAAIPTPLASGTKGPVEEAFEALDEAITKLDEGAAPMAPERVAVIDVQLAAEHLADVIRVRLREIQALALGWRETVRAHHELLAGLDETTTRITREGFTAGFLACREKVLVEVDRTSPRPELLRRVIADLVPPKPPPKEPAIVQDARRAVTLADIAHAEVPVFEWRETGLDVEPAPPKAHA